jgi:uncharacterized protein
MGLLIQQAGNLFVGDSGPNNSKHLTLESYKLPTFEENSQEHHGGGSIGAVDIGGLGLKKLDITFKLKGYDPQVMSKFGLGTQGRMPFTIYGAIRDKTTNVAKELKVVAHARLGKIEVDEFKAGDLLGHDYMLHEVWRYECYFDGVEKYWYDFEASDWRVDGVSQNADINSILRIR